MGNRIEKLKNILKNFFELIGKNKSNPKKYLLNEALEKTLKEMVVESPSPSFRRSEKDIKYFTIDSVPVSQQDLDILVKRCPNLKGIIIHNTNIKDLDFSQFGIKFIQFWDVLYRNITLPNSLEELDLREIDAREICSNIKSLNNLEVLRLHRIDAKEILAQVPETIKSLTIKNCDNIEGANRLQHLQYLNLKSCNVSALNSEMPELEELSVENGGLTNLDTIFQYCRNLKKLEVDKNPIVALLTSTVKNREFANLTNLQIRDGEIDDITGIADVFPNLTLLSLEKNPLEDIRPLLEFKGKSLSSVNMASTKIDKDMFEIIEELQKQSLCVEFEICDTPLREALRKEIIIKNDNDTKKALIKTLFGCETSSDFTKYDAFVYRERDACIKPELLQEALEIDEVNRQLINITIPINEQTNIAHIVQTIVKYSNQTNGRRVCFYIEDIPNLSPEDIEMLERHYGITFYYETEIESGLADLRYRNHNYKMDNIHVDELKNVSEQLEGLLQERVNSKSVEEKLNYVHTIMSKQFELVQPEYGTIDTPKIKDKETRELVDLLIRKQYVKNAKELEKYSDINVALRERKVSVQSYLVIAKELLNMIGIKENLRCKISKRDGKIDGVIEYQDVDAEQEKAGIWRLTTENGIEFSPKEQKQKLEQEKLE